MPRWSRPSARPIRFARPSTPATASNSANPSRSSPEAQAECAARAAPSSLITKELVPAEGFGGLARHQLRAPPNGGIRMQAGHAGDSAPARCRPIRRSTPARDPGSFSVPSRSGWCAS